MITQCSSSTRLILLLSSPPCSPLPAHVRTNPNQISPHKSPSNETHITTTPTANTHLTLKRGPYRTSPFSLLPIATVSTAAASTMAHHTNHRRNLATQEPNASPSMEPTRKKQPKSTLFKPHPKDSDPTIHTISKRFSKLYSNHRNVVVSSKSSNVSSKPPRIDTHFQAKPMPISAIEDKSISKSTHQSRKTMLEVEKEKLRASITGVFDKSLSKAHEGHDFKIEFLSGKIDEGKKSPKKGKGNKEFHEDHDVKKSFDSLSKSQDSGLKVVREGDEMKRPSFSLSVTGGRRRSFCNSQAELADFLSCNGVKVVSVDMPPFMQIHAVDCARKTCDSLEKFTSKTLAFTLKKEFDGVYGPAWHCIVGSSFGSFVTHSVGGFLYFSMDHKHYILLFKTTVQRAD